MLDHVDRVGGQWVQLAQRRLQTWGGTPHPSGIVQDQLPPFLADVANGLSQAAPSIFGTPPNHVLLNEYIGGQGIAPHRDGPMYHPRVAVLSLAGPALFELVRDGARETIMLMPRSLLLFAEDAYRDWTHSIPTRPHDDIDSTCVNSTLAGVMPGDCIPRGARRVSLTVRSVAVPMLEEQFTAEGCAEAQRRAAWFRASVNEGTSAKV